MCVKVALQQYKTPIVFENGDFQKVKNGVKNSIESEIGPTSNYKSTNLCVRCNRFSQKLLGLSQ